MSGDGQSFNDDELQDIMSEIEDLEQNFEADANETSEILKEEPIMTKSDQDEVVESKPEVEVAEVEMSEDGVEAELEELNSLHINPPDTGNYEASSADLPEPNLQAKHNSKISEIKEISRPKSSSGPAAPVGMSFEVSGDLRMDLVFDISGSQVTLKVDGEKGLEICLDNGATFNLPLSQIKKAA